MADGTNPGDAKVPASAHDQHAGTIPPVTDSAHRMVAEAQARPEAPVVGKDNTPVGSDKALDRVRDTTEKPAVDSYAHLTNAQLAANEIGSYIKAGNKETDMVTVKAPDGTTKTEKVADRIAELKKIVDTECATAVGHSNNIKQEDVTPLLQAAMNDRNAQATALKMDTGTLSKASIAAERQRTSDPTRAAALDRLAETQSHLDTLKLWSNAPAYTRMLYASFKAGGLTDPETGMQKDPSGGLRASQKDVRDAVTLLTEASANRDLRNNRLYVEAVSTVLPKLENSSVRVQTITKDLQDATKAGSTGNKVEQERLLKDAVAQADQTNTAAIAQMLKDPRFVQSQRNPAVLSDMANNAVMASTARLQYAQFLTEQGKFGEAQGLVLRVKTECPEVMYTRDPKDPTKLAYNQSRYIDLAKLDQSMDLSTSVPPNQIKNLLDDFNTAMKNGQLISKDGTRGAEDIMKDMVASANRKVTEVADGQKGLDAAQKLLDDRKKDIDSKTYLTADARGLEQNQIAREQAMIQGQRLRLEADAKEAQHQLGAVKLYEAGLNVSEEKRDTARALLAEVKNLAPDLAVAKTDGQDSFYAALEKGAKEPSWWDNNWRKVAWGVTALATAAVVGLTIWTGPGAAIFGAGTAAALATTFGIGVGASAVVGAGTYLGTHEALYHSGVVSEKVDVMADLKTGAVKGAQVGFFLGMTPMMAAAATLGGATAVVEGGAVAGEAAAATTAATAAATTEGAGAAATTLTWGAKAAIAGTNMGRIATVMGGGSVVNEGVAHWAENHTWTQSAENVVFQTLTPAILGGGMPLAKDLAFTGLRNIGWMAPAVAGANSGFTGAATYVAPKFFTASNLKWGVGSMVAFQGIEAAGIWAEADRRGPNAAKPTEMGPSVLAQQTNPFAPQRATRGYDPTRSNSDDGAESLSITSDWQDIDPGTMFSSSVARDKPAAPLTNTNSDFTDAAQLGQNPPPQK